MKKAISLLLVSLFFVATWVANAEDETQETTTTSIESTSSDYNSSRSNKPSRNWVDNDCDDSDDSCTPENQLKGKDRAAKVKQAIEARKELLEQKKEERASKIKQRVENISEKKRAQFVWAQKILDKKVSAINNVNWLKNTSEKIDRVMLDLENISNEETRALIEAVLLDLQTKIDDRLQEVYENSDDTTLEEVLEDVMWDDVMEDEDSNSEDDNDEDEDDSDDDEEDDEDEEDEENDDNK